MFNHVIRSPYRFAFSFICFLAAPVSSKNITSILDPGFAKAFNNAEQPDVIDFGDWISLLTLCLAPLIAHVVAGVPRTVHLSLRKKRWHDWICMYNPTSILWRYFAIADRRIRHRAWNATDMASTNTYFWTDHGWDGSEEIMEQGRSLCTKAPEHHRTAILSSESIKTIIIGAQGVQATYAVVTGIMVVYSVGSGVHGTAIDKVFSPLAILGLLRLFASLWLTDDYLYANRSDATEMSQLNSLGKTHQKECDFLVQERNESSYIPLGQVFHPQSYWLAIALRIFYLLLLCGLLVVCFLEVFPEMDVTNQQQSSTANFIRIVFYLFFLLISISIFVVYIVLGKSTTTVIPCMNSTLYKAYSCLLFFMALVVLIASAVYTRKSACGEYTTSPKEYDQAICNGAPIYANNHDWPFGMVAYVQGSTDSTNETNEMAIVKLDGWCSGVLGNNQVAHIVNLRP